MASKTVTTSVKQSKAQSKSSAKADAVAKAARAAIYARTTTSPVSVSPAAPAVASITPTAKGINAVKTIVPAIVKPIVKADTKAASAVIVKAGKTLFYSESFANNSLLGRAMYYAWYGVQLGLSKSDMANAKFPVGKGFKSPTSRVQAYWIRVTNWRKHETAGQVCFTPRGQTAFSEYVTAHGAIPEQVMIDMIETIKTGKRTGVIPASSWLALGAI